MTYFTESQKPRSEKITLVTIDSVQRLKLFTANGSDWEREVDFFVVAVKDDGTSLVKDTDWTFDPKLKKLTIIGGVNPKTRSISVTYRHFYSTASLILPYDLNSGEPVEWDGRVQSIGSIGQQLDEENTGIVLESSSTCTLINRDGFFDSFFDTHIWENQAISFFSWFPNIPITEKLQLFEGVIETKTFSESQITFKVKDFVFKLKNQVDLGLFSSLDGIIVPSLLDTPKRRIYGQADYVDCVSLDATLDGFDLTGTVSIAQGTDQVVGTSTLFLDEVSPGDKLRVVINSINYDITVLSVESNTALTSDKILDFGAPSGTTVKNLPEIPWRKKNRLWHLAGHKIAEPTATILIAESQNTFLMDDVSNFKAGDELLINNIETVVRRVSGNKIVTMTNIVPTPSNGDTIEKRPVKNVFFEKERLAINRDYTVTNTTECIIEIDELAEFNIAQQKTSGIQFTFTTGSREVTTAIDTDLRSILKPRDWIKVDDAGEPTWYEVLRVEQQKITTRINITLTSSPKTDGLLYKTPVFISEDSLITASCLGYEDAGDWLRTASDSVRHLVLNDAQFSQVNETTFAKANADCNYTISLVIPESLGQEPPLIRDEITKINNSVFGSLYGDSVNNISYSILNSTKPETISPLRDDDIISYTVDTNQKIINKVILNYRPFIDIFTGTKTFLKTIYNSKIVNDLIGIKNTNERTVYLYDTKDAEIMAQRICLFNSLSNSTVRLKAKLNLAHVVVNDKIYLDLDRLYSRFGGLDSRKLGTVTGVKRDGFNTELSITDLGNIYNRVPSIAPNSTDIYTNATSDDKIRWGYILDSDTETPDPTSEEGLGNFVIG